MFVYICLGYYEWLDFKISRECLYQENEYIDMDKKIWIAQQISKRIEWCGIPLNPIYCFLEKPKFRLGPAKHVICKVLVDPTNIVYFDDTLYVYLLNSTFTEKEGDEKMFTSNTSNKRAFIPYVTRNMVRKVWVYRIDKRLRGGARNTT